MMEWRKDGSHATVGEVLELFAEPEGKQWRAAVESRSGLGLWVNAPYATQKDAQRAAGAIRSGRDFRQRKEGGIMATFYVEVRRTITYEGAFEIEAESRDDAHDIATDMLSTLPNDDDRWEAVGEDDAITSIEGEEDEEAA